MEDAVLAPRIRLFDLRLSQVRAGEGPLRGIVLRHVTGAGVFLLLRAVGVTFLFEFLEFPGIVRVGKLERAAVIRIGQICLFY